MASPDQPSPKIPEPVSGNGQRPRRRSPAFRIFKIVLIVGILALIITPMARPAYRQMKAWRARSQAAHIQKHLDAKDIPGAQPFVKSAVRLAPEDPAVLLATARFCSAAGSPEAIAYWQKYLAVAGGSASAAERREYVEAALTHSRLDLVRPALAEMIRKTPSDPALLALLVRQHLVMRDLPRAAATAKALLALNPADRRSQFLLGSVLLGSSEESSRSEGRRLVWSLIVDSGPYSTEAAELLADDAGLSRMEADQVTRRLASVTNAPLGASLKLAAVRLRFEPGKAREIIETTMAKVTPGEDWAETAALAEWLLKHDASRVPAWLSPAVTSTNRALVPLRAEALAKLGLWPDLAQLLDGSRGVMEPGLTHFYKGRAAAAAGRQAEAESEYRSAIEAAGGNRRWLPLLARTVEPQGFPIVAIQAWERLLDDPRFTVEAAREISRLARPLDDLSALRRAVRRLSDFFSADDSFSAESAVLNLLFNEDIAASTKVLERLQSSTKVQPEWKAGLALARLRNNDPSGALAIMEDSTFDFASSPARTQAIYVAALGASKQREAARRFASRIRAADLRLQERNLVQPWL